MKIRYTYKSFSNCPQATAYSREREEVSMRIGMLTSFLSIVAVILFLVCSFDLFEKANWLDFFGAVAFLATMAVADFLAVFCRPITTECELKIILIKSQEEKLSSAILSEFCRNQRAESKREKIRIAKIYFPVFVLIMFAVISSVGAIKGVQFLCHQRDGLVLLLCALFSLGAEILIAWYLYCKHKPTMQMPVAQASIQVHRSVQLSNQQHCDEVAFCRKCGSKILSDSVFCSKCGTQAGVMNMFCRFCGKQIQDDSDFCQYCGRQQEACTTISANRSKITTISNDVLSIIASISFYIGIVVFLIFYIKMSMGFWAYIIGAAIVVGLAVCVHKIRDKSYTWVGQIFALIFGLVLLISSVGIRIVYECKVDEAVAAIPTSGSVHLKIKLDEEFYSYFYDGMVREPSSSILYNDDVYEGTFTITVELNKTYSLRVNAGYQGMSGVANSSNYGHVYQDFTFTANDLKDGYTSVIRVPLDNGGYAEVTLVAERICTFWEVVFF